MDPATNDLLIKMSRFHIFEISLLIIPYLASTCLNLALWYYIRLYLTRNKHTFLNDENNTHTTNCEAFYLTTNGTRSSRSMKPLDSYHIVLIATNLTDLPLYFLSAIQVYDWHFDQSTFVSRKPLTYSALIIYMLGHSLDFFIYFKFHKKFNATVKNFIKVN